MKFPGNNNITVHLPSILYLIILMFIPLLQEVMEPHNFLVRQVLHYDTDLQVNKQRPSAILGLSAKS